MKQNFFLIFFLFNFILITAQESTLKDKVVLKTGEVYIGEIILNTDEIIMLRTLDGTRFQIRQSEISTVGKESNTLNIVPDLDKPTEGNIKGIIEFSGGVSSARNLFNISPNTQIALIFGTKKLFGEKLFMGAGIGYNATFLSSNSSEFAFIPLFFRLQSTPSKSRTSPFLNLDAGYSFVLKSGYQGGIDLKLSAGIKHRINFKTDFYAGFYAGINSFSGNLVETNELGSFSYYGNTSMTSFGAKVGLQF